MYRNHTVGVVVPAHNEAPFVGEVIDTLPAFVDRVYPVDDASTDGTWEVLTERAAPARDAVATVADGGAEADVRVVPLRHETNQGVGAAIRTGYRRAHADGMDVVAVMDGDGQMDPEMLDRLLDPIVAGRAAYAKGNRLLSPSHRDGMSRWRLFGNALLTGLTRVASGYWTLMDSQNGYTAISRHALETIDLDRLYDGYGFRNDLLVALNVARLPVADVSIPAIYGEERSGIRYRSFVPRLSRLLLSGFLWRLRGRYLVREFHPLVGLYVLSVVGLLTWAVQGIQTVRSRDAGPAEWPALVLLGLTSGLAALLAMAFDVQANDSLHVVVDRDD